MIVCCIWSPLASEHAHNRLAARLYLKRQRSSRLRTLLLLVQTARRDDQRHDSMGERARLLNRLGHLNQMAVIDAGDQHRVDLDLNAPFSDLPDALKVVMQQQCCLERFYVANAGSAPFSRLSKKSSHRQITGSGRTIYSNNAPLVPITCLYQ